MRWVTGPLDCLTTFPVEYPTMSTPAVVRAKRRSPRRPTDDLDDGERCRHCHYGVLSCCGGLCHKCHKDLSVRVLYTDKRYGDGTTKGNKGGNLPCEPTDALPGTPEKVAVLEERVRLGQVLWHPLDAVWAGQGCLDIEVPSGRGGRTKLRRGTGVDVTGGMGPRERDYKRRGIRDTVSS